MSYIHSKNDVSLTLTRAILFLSYRLHGHQKYI